MAEKRQGRTGRLPADMAALIPDRLLDAATALFTENGFGRTTMEAIARKARASTKTVYSRYADKEEIFSAVVRRLLDRAIASSDRLAATNPDSADPCAFLIRAGRQLAALSVTSEIVGLDRLVMAEASRFPDLAKAVIAFHRHSADFISVPIQRWRNSGYLPYISDSKRAASLFVEMVSSLPRTRAILGLRLHDEETETLVTQAVEIFLRGSGFQFDEPRIT